jgi:hypothetical protein
VLLYLIERHGKSLQRLLYEQSGLLGFSGISSDMRELLSSSDSRAAEALDLFVYRINRELGSLAAALGGIDALLFTGGIGENAASIRARVCRDASWLGLELDEGANASGGPCISRAGSRVSAWVIPTNEELMIALHTRRLLEAGGHSSRSKSSNRSNPVLHPSSPRRARRGEGRGESLSGAQRLNGFNFWNDWNPLAKVKRGYQNDE